LRDQVESRRDFNDPLLGPQLLAMRSGARSSATHLLNLLGSRGAVSLPQQPGPIDDWPGAVIRHGLAAGLSRQEMFDCVMGARVGLGQVAVETSMAGYGVHQPQLGKGFGVQARAMRAEHPGLVFARAATTGEADPLGDLDARLLVGLGPDRGRE
jgi:hypothetical protein